jgi:hypothetical protein
MSESLAVQFQTQCLTQPTLLPAGVPATIPNPGVLMGLPHEKLLHQLCYYHFHMNRVQRDFTANAGATLAKLTEL